MKKLLSITIFIMLFISVYAQSNREIQIEQIKQVANKNCKTMGEYFNKLANTDWINNPEAKKNAYQIQAQLKNTVKKKFVEDGIVEVKNNGKVSYFNIEDYCGRLLSYKELFNYDKVKIEWFIKNEDIDNAEIKKVRGKENSYEIELVVTQLFEAFRETNNEDYGSETSFKVLTNKAYSSRTSKTVKMQIDFDNISNAVKTVKFVWVKITKK